MYPVNEADAREERIGRIINDFLDRRIQGDSVSEQALIDQYPDLADDLRVRLAALHQIPTSPVAATGEGRWSHDSDLPGADAIPGYTIVREIHRGGQGVVYQAIQNATKQKVAVKVLLAGPFAGRIARHRFEREIELAAALKCPNIVAIHDSGSANGRNYFVMDYIRGETPTLYVSRRKLAVRQTLELFLKICQAIEHAHNHGVIHRDIKPSNILVDADGEPHVLDFGLAKTAGSSVVGESRPMLLSLSGQVIGTLAYMSPEQARGEPEAVDVRTDVYALGVILYEMLTGKYPYQVDGLAADVVRNIVETPPASPHKTWQPDSGVMADLAARRMRRTRCPIDHEIETIVLRCLQKERDRRYQGAGDLARDIRRYLDGEPLEAKRDSTGYVIRKMLRRHRRTAGVAAILALVVGASALLIGRERVRNRTLLHESEASRILASFVSEPEKAVAQLAGMAPAVGERIRDLSGAKVASTAYTERVAGARSALKVNDEAFWRGVDDGLLWSEGEWLEVCRIGWKEKDLAEVLDKLCAKASNGTPRQKYVALCLLGQIAGERSGEITPARKDAMLKVCELAAASGHENGPVAAAHWAARQLGRTLDWPKDEAAFVKDAVTGAVFTRVPGGSAFKRGSGPDDPDRWPDEDRPASGVTLAPFLLANTEVTVGEFARFLDDPANASWLVTFGRIAPGEDKIAALCKRLWLEASRFSPDNAAGYVTLPAARAYCEWLNKQAAGRSLPQRFRLPTEDEWEYACRAGNNGRFCYGWDARNTRYFSDCDGNVQHHWVAQRMPNWFGLWDMHGGVWEWCDTRYVASPASQPAADKPSEFVIRGGAFYSPATRCRSSQRRHQPEAVPADQFVGIRLVMELPDRRESGRP